jgi:hypothetical protein
VPGLGDLCAICRQDLGYTLPNCRLCRKSVCGSCQVRRGGSIFCSRDCAHAFFFGGEDEGGGRSGEEE